MAELIIKKGFSLLRLNTFCNSYEYRNRVFLPSIKKSVKFQNDRRTKEQEKRVERVNHLVEGHPAYHHRCYQLIS